MNAVIKPEAAEIPALLIALAGACQEIDPLSAGRTVRPSDELLEAVAVLSAWVPSFAVVLQEARNR